MAGESDLILDGFRLLDRMPLEEIKKRIFWLEESLSSYKTLLAVKLVMENRPTGVDLPPQWESVVDIDRETKALQAQAAEKLESGTVGPIKRGQLGAAVLEYVKKFPQGIKIKAIADALCSSAPTIYKIVLADKRNYVCIRRGCYVFCGDGSREVIAELARSADGAGSSEPVTVVATPADQNVA